MGYILSDLMENFLREHIEVSDPLLLQLEQEALEGHVAIIRREVGQLLRLITQLVAPNSVLEIGTAIGYSTLWMAPGIVKRAGHITTIERNPQRHKRANEVFQLADLTDNITSILGDASDVIPRLDSKFQLIFVDAAKGQYLNWYPQLRTLLAPGGALVADNVLYHGMVLPHSKFPRRQKTAVTRLRRYLQEVQQPPWTSLILPLGDGVAVSLLQEDFGHEE